MAKWPFRALPSQAKSWLAEIRNSQQEDQEQLCPLPTLWTATLRQRLVQWPRPAAYLTPTQQRLKEAITDWQQTPEAPNCLVLLSSPVEDTEGLIDDLGEGWRDVPQAVKVWHPMPWHLRPPDPCNLAEQFSDTLADIQAQTTEADDDHPDPLSGRRSLVVMPPLEQCFLRCIGGWQGIEWLRDTVGQYPQFFWVIRCNTWAWAFLNRVCQLEAYFSNRMVLPPLDEAQIADWLKPFAASLVAELPTVEPDIPADVALDWLDQHGWSWSALANLAQGQAAVAQQLWLRSLRLQEADYPESPQPLAEADPLPVPPQILPATLPRLPDLTANDQYVLHALMLHGLMTRSHLAQALGLTETLVEVTVRRLRQADILRQTRQGIALDPAYYPQVLAELRANNFLTGEDA